MTEKTIATTKTTDLPEVSLGTTKQAIGRLRNKYPADDVPDASTKEGMLQIKGVLKDLVPRRTEIEKIRKELVAGAVAWQKKVNSEAKELIDTLQKIEEPYKAAKQAEDDRVAREKQEKIDAENKRVADIEAKVDAIQGMTDGLLGADMATLQSRLDEANSIVITEDGYMEFVGPATLVLDQAKSQLTNAVEMAKQNAAQQEQINKQQREAELKASVQRIQMAPVDLIGKPSADIEAAIVKLQSIDPIIYGELVDEAAAAVKQTVVKLEAMLEQQQGIEQRKARDEEAAKKANTDEEAAELAARLPECTKLRAYADALVRVEVPEVQDPQLASVLRDALLAVTDVKNMIYDYAQEPEKQVG